jgi:hypothetical protein
VFKVECCIDFGDQIGGYAVPVATASGSVRLTISLVVASGYHKHAPTSTSPRSTGFSV